MTREAPASTPEWAEFLRGYSADYLRLADETDLAGLDEAQRDNRWLGRAPASPSAVVAAEDRLAVRLPPSYRNFLLASNGWSRIDPQVRELLPVEQIGWFTDIESQLWDGWSDEVALLTADCLLVSGWTDVTVFWLLDTTDVGPDGECTAYEWAADEGTAPEPYPSFGHLAASARAAFVDWRTTGVLEKHGYRVAAPPQ